MAHPYHARAADQAIELYRPNWSPPKNGQSVPDGHAWGHITCVPADYVPQRKPRREPAVSLPRGFWCALVRELVLRLERTPSEQLRIPFANRDLASRAYSALIYHFRVNAVDVIMQTGFYESPPALYVRRGPAWTKHAPSESERTATS